ncbi:phage/plasmid primase, P4 family [Niabella sp. W65]|nr:phage/plasmid primase, P4 family [Niabella sp. W65]MCH7368610.1 phage/plasmid primase, P4 family [Niabella sp. W65]ULT44199.1 phage/plasmid primase, P4 family [Niabella sp. I65]
MIEAIQQRKAQILPIMDVMRKMEGTDLVKPHSEVLEALLEDVINLNYFELNGFKPVSKSDYVVITINTLLDLADEKGWQIRYKQKTVYLYNGEYWKPLEDSILKHFLSRVAVKMGVDPNRALYHKFQDELLMQFYASGFMPPSETDKNETRINLLNGTYVFNHSGGYLREFRPEDFLTYQLPFNYDPAAKRPLFTTYMYRCLPDISKQHVLQEFVASLFIPKAKMKLEKILVLIGEGANGKSVFSDLIRALLGKENVSGFSTGELCDPKSYSLHMLQDKLLNYASEFSGSLNAERLKTIGSGEAVGVRPIYKEPYMMEDYARLAFNCNVLPKEVEQTEGFFRRFLIVEFDETIPEAERDLSLADKIINSELAGIFNWLLEGLNRLLTTGKMTISAAVTSANEKYKKESDNVACWLDDQDIKPGTDPRPLAELYKIYKDYCHDNGYRPLSNKNLLNRMGKAGFESEKRSIGKVVFTKNTAPFPY